MTVIEVMATSVESARMAMAGGADRIELCENTCEGGTTPSAGTIELTCALGVELGIPVFVMIRPRGGDFVFSETEVAVMLRDIESALSLGAAGIVTGVLLPNGQVDAARTATLVEAAVGLPVTFHRAFDQTPRPVEALDLVTEAGCRRVLTSGGAETAVEGIETLRELVDLDLATVIAAGSINEENAARIVAETGVTQIHAALRTSSAGSRGATPSDEAPKLGAVMTWGPQEWPVPDVQRLGQLRQAL